MKVHLNTKFTITYIIISTILFTISAVILYQYLRKEVDEKVEWRLHADKERILDTMVNSDSLVEKRSMYHIGSLISKRYIEINKLNDAPSQKEEIKDTLLPTFLFGGTVERPYRQLRFYTPVDDQYYEIILRQQLVESRDLREGIVNSLLYVFIALLVVLAVTNFLIVKSTWSPFYRTIGKIRNYNFTDDQVLALPKTEIIEFKRLNEAIHKMAVKIRKDFINLKEFTENASHEIQTPLSVIKSKLELLMQSENLTKVQCDNIESMNDAVRKLTRLNQSLILITKIENAQFRSKETIHLKPQIEKIIANYDDVIEAKGLQLEVNLDPNATLEMDQTLAESLLSNLLSNAIKYSIPDGMLRILLTMNEFKVSNTGEPYKDNPEELFKRFRKNQKSKDSLGLGLSIVQSICDYYNLEIQYHILDQTHEVSILF